MRLHHLKMAATFARRRLSDVHPFEIQASLLNACNLRCVYCKCPTVKTELMSTAQWQSVLAELGQLGALRIKFQGGEPTLRSDFAELARSARRAGIRTGVTTNGQRMAEEPELLDEVDEVVFSLDAAEPEINDRLRGQGTHEKVMTAISEAKARDRLVVINMVVSRETLPQVEPMLEMCETRGLLFNAQPMVVAWHYADFGASELALDNGEIRQLHQQLATWKRAGRPMIFSAKTYERSARWSDYSRLKETSEQPSKCVAGRDYFHIEPNGDVYPCGFFAAESFTPLSAVKDLKAALRNARTHHCADCWHAYLNERKAAFGLQPAAIWQVLSR